MAFVVGFSAFFIFLFKVFGGESLSDGGTKPKVAGT